jgi:hypothetical protein
MMAATLTMTPAQRAIYKRLLGAAKAIGPFTEDPKQTSIHLMRRSAFAGVATRKDALLLTIKSATDIRSLRIVKREQTSANRLAPRDPTQGSETGGPRVEVVARGRDAAGRDNPPLLVPVPYRASVHNITMFIIFERNDIMNVTASSSLGLFSLKS